MSRKFGIFGYGFVGKATHKGILRDGPVTIYDIASHPDIEPIFEADTIFMCIPTNDQSDIEVLDTHIQQLRSRNPKVQIIIRSTLPIGTMEILQDPTSSIHYMPEFLRERYWETDCLKRPLILGTDDPKDDEFEWLKEETRYCSTAEAELVKMFNNNYGTLRIAFANIFYDLACSQGADYNRVRHLFTQVEQNQTYMEVPGPDGKRGFGGKCLPKDLDFLIDALPDLEAEMFQSIKRLNKIWR